MLCKKCYIISSDAISQNENQNAKIPGKIPKYQNNIQCKHKLDQ